MSEYENGFRAGAEAFRARAVAVCREKAKDARQWGQTTADGEQDAAALGAYTSLIAASESIAALPAVTEEPATIDQQEARRG